MGEHVRRTPNRVGAVSSSACPCGGVNYAACCEPYLAGARAPDTAEQLMRSRYTAFARDDESYLLATWHSSTRPPRLELASRSPANWLGLKIVKTEAGHAGDTHGIVEFIARYKIGGKASRLQETSRFIREGGRWYYVDGDTDHGGPLIGC